MSTDCFLCYERVNAFLRFTLMNESGSSTQWDSLLCNVGIWQGSFTRLTSTGGLIEDIPTEVSLEGINDDQTMRQTLRYFSPVDHQLTQERVLEYSTLNRGTLFFDNGAFSFGSMQWAPLADFGAESGFIRGDRRLRLVQLFGKDGQLQITLIREHRQGTPPNERPPLTVDQLLGDWTGEAVTLYPDWRSPDIYTTQLSIRREGDRLHQTLTAPQFSLSSRATIADNRLLFDEGRHPIQVLLLPDGASSNTPVTLPKGQPLSLEAGWLAEDNLRYRMIRRYDERGGWVSLTLITETRVQ